MRFLMYSVDKIDAASAPPTPELLAELGAFTEEMKRTGVLLATGGLSSTGTRVRNAGGKLTVYRHMAEKVVDQVVTLLQGDGVRKDRPRCGARTRKGVPCLVRVEPGKRRCRFHGGLSCGPTTAEGKARIAAAQRRRWAEWRARLVRVRLSLGDRG